jgi:membrane protein YqaA with SNARE-associated domain
MKSWFKNLNHLLLRLEDSKLGMLILFALAFTDAAVIPLPVTTIFLIVLLQNPKRSLQYILITVTATVSGAIAGYVIGHSVFIRPDGEFTRLVNFLFANIPGFSVEIYEKIRLLYLKWDFRIICIATVTPIPYALFSITSGIFGMNLFVFILTTLICQTIKHFVIFIFVLKIRPKLKNLLSINWKHAVAIVTISILLAIVFSSFA